MSPNKPASLATDGGAGSSAVPLSAVFPSISSIAGGGTGLWKLPRPLCVVTKWLRLEVELLQFPFSPPVTSLLCPKAVRDQSGDPAQRAVLQNWESEGRKEGRGSNQWLNLDTNLNR